MTNRIRINLIFFAILGVVVTVWAVTTLISIDALRRPFRVTAEFSGAPGLRPDLEVSYLGVRVGKIGPVKLRPGKVDVGLDMDRGVEVPSSVHARVLRKSAIGEPYVELSDPGTGPARPLKAGDHIPLQRTASTVEYKQFFDAAARLLRAVRPQDARILVNEIAAGLDGRSQSLHDTVADTAQLTDTLAANAPLLDDLSSQLTRATGLLADHRGELRSGAQSLAAFTAALRASENNLTHVLDGGAGFLTDANSFIATARPGLSCLLSAAGAQSPPLLTPQAAVQLRQGLSGFPQLEKVVNDVVVRRSSREAWLKATFIVSIAGPVAAEEYARPTPKPVPPPLAECRAASTAQSRTEAAATQARPAAPGAPSSSTDEFGLSAPISAKDTASTPPSTTARMLPLLPIVTAAVVLLGAVANALSAVRRRRTS